MFKEKTNEAFIDELKIKRPDIIPLEEYKGYKTEISVIHLSCNKNFLVTPNKLLTVKNVCPFCFPYKRKSHEQFVDELFNINPNIEVIGTYKKKNIPIKIKFKECGHSYETSPTSLLIGRNCKYCSNNNVLIGFNDLATTDPWTVQYFVNKDEVTKYTHGSHKKVLLCCPLCGKEKESTILNLYKSGFSCQYCSDGISYPNKFCRAFLSQLPIKNYIPECEFEWTNHKRYDNYFEYKDKKYVVEMDGGFHYKSTNYQSYEETHRIDIEKDLMAIKHDIEMIRIDCAISSMDYIKKNILNSKLNELFMLDEVDWNLCDLVATSNLVKEVCEFYQIHKFDYTSKEIAEIFNISKCTFDRYKQIGYRIGLCNDTDDEVKLLRSYRIKRDDSHSVAVFDSNHTLLKTFHSVPFCSKYINVFYGINSSIRSIIEHCKSPGKLYKGYYFEYV